MHLPTLPTLLLLLTSALTLPSAADEFDSSAPPPPPTALPRTLTLHSWPLSSRTPEVFGTVRYDPGSRVGHFEPSQEGGGGGEGEGEGGLVRIGVISDKTWFGTVVEKKQPSSSSSPERQAVITLYIDDAGYPFYLEYTTQEPAEASASASGTTAVSIVPAPPAGPVPRLNRPVVLDADGKVPVPEVEKTFLQKYWWVLLGGAIILIGGGGGSE